MNDEIIERTLREAEYIVKTGETIRQTAKVFLVAKSTTHKDVSERLKYIDKELYFMVKKILEKNLSERHIRGGEATKRKYLASFVK